MSKILTRPCFANMFIVYNSSNKPLIALDCVYKLHPKIVAPCARYTNIENLSASRVHLWRRLAAPGSLAQECSSNFFTLNPLPANISRDQR